MKIQEIAKKAGISESAIRFYEKNGILSDRHIKRLPNGYREFSESALDELNGILRLKKVGLDLDQIRNIIIDRDYDCETLREDIVVKIKLAEEIISEQLLKIQILNALKSKCELNCNTQDQAPCCG